MNDREKLRTFVAAAAESMGHAATQIALRAAVVEARASGALRLDLSEREVKDEVARWFSGLCLAEALMQLEEENERRGG